MKSWSKLVTHGDSVSNKNNIGFVSMSKTIFKKVDFDLGGLVNAIALGQIGLPEIQRPFVWKNAKVRNLFDSMYKGYPVGYLLFWENGVVDETRSIGTDQKQIPSQLVIVDDNND